MLKLENISISREQTKILDNVNLEFSTGVHFIMGPNGAGKSTLAHAIMGNPLYDIAGTVLHNNRDITDEPTHIRAQEGIFLSFQNPTPIQGLSNFQLIKNMIGPRADSTKSIATSLNAFRGLAKDFNLSHGWDKLDLNVHASGGEKKKNELIQMLMFDPSVAILDEPDSGLDIDSINLLIKTLKDFTKNNNKCLIVISHYEKLLTSLQPTTVSVVANNTATQFTDTSVVKDICTNGFKQYQTQ